MNPLIEHERAVAHFMEEWHNSLPYIEAHTSGTTGAPKRIELLKSDMLASAQLTNQYLHIDHHSTLLLALSPSYIAGKMMIVRALAAQCQLQVLPPSSNPLLDREIGKVDLCAVVPMQLMEILKEPRSRQQLSQIKQLLIGGAAISPSLEAELQSLTTTCYATYGMTETVSHIALKQLNGADRSSNYKAIGGVTFALDRRGCLVIHTPHFSHKEFITNDIVELKSATQFSWVARYDHVINSGGVKILPEVVEAKLAPHLTAPFYITGLSHRKWGEMVVLVVERVDAPTSIYLAELQQLLVQHLTPYEVPKVILFTPQLTRTESGKVKRIVVQ